MTKGVVFVAHNNGIVNYYEMAAYAAQRVKQYLDLPVTVITDVDSLRQTKNTFSNTILVEPNTHNSRHKNVWINKNRYRVYDLSPYDETLVLDTDYVVNSNKLLQLFNQNHDFKVHNSVRWLMMNNVVEYIGTSKIPTCWATVMFFRKSSRVQQIFDMMEMIQNNYEHYAQIYGFLPNTYRNDYALTIAMKTVNGHLENKQDYIPWSLIHIDKKVNVKQEFQHTVLSKTENNIKWYLRIKDIDFHMLSKTNFLELHK